MVFKQFKKMKNARAWIGGSFLLNSKAYFPANKMNCKEKAQEK